MAHRTAQFYAAFYRWSLLTASHRVRHVPRRTLTTTTRLRQADDDEGGPRISRISHSGRNTTTQARQSADDAGNEGKLQIFRRKVLPVRGEDASRPYPGNGERPRYARETVFRPGDERRSSGAAGRLEAWRTSPVQNTTERASSSLGVWEEVVRYRSCERGMLHA